MNFATADLCDTNEALLDSGEIRVAEAILSSFGGRRAFHGAIATLRIFEDNGLVRAVLEKPGDARVLIVDGGGSLRRALVGDQLAALALKNGWGGVVVNGCIRDSAAIASMALGVLALGRHPRKTVKNSQGERDVAVSFAGVTFRPGEWLYADEDGILVSRAPLHQ